MATAINDSAQDYCAGLVRTYDRDRYFSTLFASAEKRPALISLYAFNIEITRIRDAVSEPPLGEIRLQWWREEINGIYQDRAGNQPVIQALAPVIRDARLPEETFQNLIDARTFDLYDDPMPTLNDLEGYLGETSSALFQLAAMILTGNDARTAATASGNAGIAYGLTGLLRELPKMRARGQCYLPKDILTDTGSSPAHILSGRWEKKEQAAINALCNTAREHLDAARALCKDIPDRALPAFLPCALIEDDFRQLQERGLNPLKDTARAGRLNRQWRILRAAATKRF
ncbi:MAG: phytoene/squalene synthase family protein [Hyphomicrobiales bacterium]